MMKNAVIRRGVTFGDFCNIFKVFENFPFFEKWTELQLSKEFDKLYLDGFIFGYYLDNHCVALLTMRPYVTGEHPVSFEENAKVMYLSDVATLYNYRGHGIGTDLFHHAIEYCSQYDYTHIYLRTNEENSMSYGIAKRCGFHPIFDVCQEVERIRVDGTITKDLRIFMQKKL